MGTGGHSDGRVELSGKNQTPAGSQTRPGRIPGTNESYTHLFKQAGGGSSPQQSTDSIERVRGKHLTEFTNGHVQLEWERGGWIVRNWHTIGTRHATWIHPEENLLSALIRPPSRPENDDLDPKLGTVTGLHRQNPGQQEWPIQNRQE